MAIQKGLYMSSTDLQRYVTTKTTSMTGWLLVLALLGATGFIVFRYTPFGETRAVTTPPAALNVSIHDTEDLRRHLDHAIAAQKQATAALQRSQDWMDRALLDNDQFTVRRLQLARSASKSAEAQINWAQDELDIAKTILSERSNNNETANDPKR